MRLALLFLMFVTNAQAQWQLLSLGATNSAYKINDLCFVNDSVGFAGCWLDDGSPGAIFKTTDGALSWTKTEFPNSIKDVDFISADTGYAVGIAGRVYRTVDQGNSWQLHNTLSPWWDLRSIDFGPGGVSYIGSSAAFCSFCYDSVLVLLRSHDGWQTFEPVALPDSLLTNPWAQLYKVWHLNADTFFVVSVNSVYRTTDGGLTYDYDPVWGNSYTAFLDLFFNPSSQTLYLAGRANADATNQMGALHRSEDYGATWQEIPPPLAWLGWDTLAWLYEGHFVSAQVGYVAGGEKWWGGSAEDAGIMMTTDGGLTWKDDPTEGNHALIFFALECPSPQVCYAGGYNGVVMKKTDAALLTSVEKARPGSGVTLYPNPVIDILHHQSSEPLKGLSIYNVCGQCVLVPPIRSNEIDVSRLTPGVYILEITTDSTRVRQRFVKI